MDFSVTDFNVRLRTIRLREVVLAIVIGFVLNVVLVVIFPTLGESVQSFLKGIIVERYSIYS